MAAENAPAARGKATPLPPRPRGAGSPPPATAQVRLSWLLTALGLLALAALCCAYLSLCLLFLQGQWQILYHPSRTVLRTPAAQGLAYTPVQFAPDDAGRPQLTAWWLPARTPDSTPGDDTPGSRPNSLTVLFLHDATGSLSDTVPTLARLHAVGCNVFAIDYRGFGVSGAAQPTEAGLVQDTQSALTYLTETRHVAAAGIVLWGQGIGATLAAQAAQPPAAFGGLVLQDANPTARSLLEQDPRTRLLPLRLLQRDRLDPSPALGSEPLPKLFLKDANAGSSRTETLAALAAPPRLILNSGDLGGIRQWLASLAQSGGQR